MKTERIMYSVDGSKKGKIINLHSKTCQIEGCNSDCSSVRWEDGKLTLGRENIKQWKCQNKTINN